MWPALVRSEDSSAFFVHFVASIGHSLGVLKFVFSCATLLAVLALPLAVASSVALGLGAGHGDSIRLDVLGRIRTSIGRHCDP